jgi:succinate dehydrogenase / fumarate reductase cytochrome b subunit
VYKTNIPPEYRHTRSLPRACAPSILHHFCAGIRYLLLDLEIGVEKADANRSAIIVFFLGLALTAIVGLKLFGLY